MRGAILVQTPTNECMNPSARTQGWRPFTIRQLSADQRAHHQLLDDRGGVHSFEVGIPMRCPRPYIANARLTSLRVQAQ